MLDKKGIPENDASITVIQPAASTTLQSLRLPRLLFASFCFRPTNESGFGRAGVADFARNTCVVTLAVRRVITRLAGSGRLRTPLINYSKDSVAWHRQSWLYDGPPRKLRNQAPIASAEDLWRKHAKVAESPLKTNALPARRANETVPASVRNSRSSAPFSWISR